MSKREGTLYTIPDLAERGFGGPDVRLFLLRHHYRAPIPFDLALLDEAAKTRAKLNHFVHYEMAERPAGGRREEFAARVGQARQAFRRALESDLNTSAALAALHDFMTAANRLEPSAEEAAEPWRAISTPRRRWRPCTIS
jgi:cysteinyl-tRNA synthetase